MVQVHHDEEVANRIDPESCADTREGIGEALTGERIGQPLSRESTLILGADVVPGTEGNTDGRDNASAQPIPQQGRWLQQVVTGYFNYHAVPTNSSTLTAFLFHVTNLWRRTLQQRSQKDWTTWERIKRLADDWLPKPRILHPWPKSRFAVRHPRWEPYARIGPARICAGGAR
jgi:hypothetical protein